MLHPGAESARGAGAFGSVRGAAGKLSDENESFMRRFEVKDWYGSKIGIDSRSAD